MKMKLKSSSSHVKTLLLLTVLCIFSAAACCLLGEIALPILVAILSAVYLFDEEKRVFSLVSSVSVLALNFVSFFLGLSFSFFAVEAILFSALICFFFNKKLEKCDLALILTVVFALFIALSALLVGMKHSGEYTIDSALGYFEELTVSLRTLFAKSAMEVYGPIFESNKISVSISDFEAIFDSQIDVIISYVLIAAFALVGISLKLFSLLVYKLSGDMKATASWRFITPPLFAYFYIALVFISMFTATSSGIFAVSVANLYNIFMVVYAYVGFNFLFAVITMHSAKLKPFVVILGMILALLIFPGIAVQILSAMGALFTIRKQREIPKAE